MSKDLNLSNAPRSSQTIGSKDPACTDFGEDFNLSLAIEQHLGSLQDFGVSVLPRGQGEHFELFGDELESDLDASDPDESPKSNAAAPSTPAVATASQPRSSTHVVGESHVVSESKLAPAPVASVGLETPYPVFVAAGDRPDRLSVIQSEVASCTRCPQLCEHRTNTVFGVGDTSSRLVLVGEGPGEQEDREGEPFVGAAGQLLNKILAACGLRREQVYILNTVKCRPPQNRNPKPEELANCWNYGQRQLDILQPEFICCLGSVAAKTVLNTNLSVGKLRKRFHQYRGSKVLVTYHPAYLLRTSSAKIHAWNDMKMLMNEMGIKIPTSSAKD